MTPLTNYGSTFVQLSKEDCSYLLTLIEEMDAGTAYTARQRGYTVPKLQKIQNDPKCARLAFQDVDYLLELIEDDSEESCEQQREMTKQVLLDIQGLQARKFDELKDIESQREMRRARRSPTAGLQGHFERTGV